MEQNYLIRSFFVITNTIRRYLDRLHSEFLITSGQSRVLRFIHLSHPEDISQKDLEEELRLRGPSITGLIDGLVKLKYVTRSYDPHDRRKKIIKITKSGQMVAMASFNILKDFESQIKDLLNPEQVKQLSVMLETINDYVKEKEETNV